MVTRKLDEPKVLKPNWPDMTINNKERQNSTKRKLQTRRRPVERKD